MNGIQYAKNILRKTFMDIIDLSLVQIVRFNKSPAALKIQLLIIGKVISIHRDWCNMEFDLGIVVHGTAKRTQKLKVNNDGREKIVNYSFNRELIRHLHISDKIFTFEFKPYLKNILNDKVIFHSIVLVYITSIVVFYVYRHQLRVLMEYILLLS